MNAALVKFFFQYNSDADWMNIFSKIYSSFPGKKMMKAFQNLDENSAELLLVYLSGGAYFLARKWILNDIPMSPKEVAAVVLSVLDKERVF